MGDNDISVSISQGSSEEELGLVAADKASKAMIELEKNSKMISILKMSDYGCDNVGDFDYGQDLSTFHKPYTALIKIKLFLFFSIILLPVKCEFSCEKSELNRALNVIHGEIFGVARENKYYHIWSWISWGR
jgi:hypothetical protein